MLQWAPIMSVIKSKFFTMGSTAAQPDPTGSVTSPDTLFWFAWFQQCWPDTCLSNISSVSLSVLVHFSLFCWKCSPTGLSGDWFLQLSHKDPSSKGLWTTPAEAHPPSHFRALPTQMPSIIYHSSKTPPRNITICDTHWQKRQGGTVETLIFSETLLRMTR